MNRSLNRLRRKYIVTASLIVTVLILLMIAMLNLLMEHSYRHDTDMLYSVIGQAAASHADSPNTEHFILEEAEMTKEGDYIIPRCVRDISSITVYGTIRNQGDSAIWYSAGGGLLFEAETPGGVQMVYKDYSFSRDITNVSIDFESLDNLKCGMEPLSIEPSQAVGDYFLVSVVWWKKSSNVPTDTDESISLVLDSIDIHYKDSSRIAITPNQLIPHSSFGDVFESGTPEVLNNAGAFYLIADGDNRLVSVNDGSLLSPLRNMDARRYAAQILESGRDSGSIERDGSVYSCRVLRENGRSILIFVNDSVTASAAGSLLWISLIAGGFLWAVLFVLIVIVSGHVVKPMADAIENQKQFISNASHELKTPITVISAAVDVISEKKGDDNWTECIREQTRKMKRLVSELLDLSRLMESRAARGNFALCDVSSAVENTLLYFESLLFEKGKALRQRVDADIRIRCDEEKISQLVSIFMDNALKYADGDITFSLTRERDQAVIRCSNPCRGTIQTEKLFDRFYRMENDQSHEQEGFGLGLAIAQAIVRLHGGSIGAVHENGVITFTASIPAK